MRINSWLWRSVGLARRNHPGRYTLLLFMILLLLLSEPLFVAHADLQMLATLMMIFLLFAALYTLNVGKAFFRRRRNHGARRDQPVAPSVRA